MKNKKRIFIVGLVVVLLVAALAVTGLATDAHDTPVELRILGKNLSLEDSVYIFYAVPVQGTAGADVELLVWLTPQNEYTYGTQSYRLSPEPDTLLVKGEECYLFRLQGLAAKQMTENVYARAYASVAGESGTKEYYSDLEKYSILQYCYNMLGKTSSTVPDEKTELLLNSLLDYGAAAQIFFEKNTDRLANADYYRVQVVGGSLLDNTASGLYQEYDEVLIIAPETDSNGTPFSGWQNSDGKTVSKDASYTVSVGRRNEVYTAFYCTHENKTTIEAFAPNCLSSGRTEGSYCADCGEIFTESKPLASTGVHVYQNKVCVGCGQSEVPLTAVPSVYDTNGDGKTETYYFSPLLTDRFDDAIHVWAGDYDTALSTSVKQFTDGGLTHWYLADATQYLVYRVTVPKAGLYEMAIHLRMKDEQLRGALFTVNEGTAYEQNFSTTHSFNGTAYETVRDSTSLSSYMYGITLNLVEGENIIKIQQSTATTKNQHYRDFYFARIGDTHYHNYENETVLKAGNCSRDGRSLVSCSCGLEKEIEIPASGAHRYVDGVCTVCERTYAEFGILYYDFLYDQPGFAGGDVEFCPEITDTYTFYWGDSKGQLVNYTMLYSDTFVADVPAEITIQSFTAIPEGATKLLAINADQTVVYSYDIPAERLFKKEELYSFGAISDSHQGDRYGDQSIPYNHFIDAVKDLDKMGAIVVGMAGDFSYENEEFEYQLHADAIRELYQYNSKLPIYTVSGNHECKYTGFSKDWFLKYSRNVVDYDTNLLPIFSEGNDLDFTIELPDGSVMLYLNQIYYDYGKTTSRLLDDYQITWLENQLEKYKDRTVFLFFHTFIDGEAGDAQTSTGKEYSLPLISETVEYQRFTELFSEYTNVVYFSGHSHQSFDLQLMDPKTDGRTNLYTNIDNNNGTFATMVHIPSVAATRSGTSLSDDTNRSEGYVVHVYEDCIVFQGYDFVNDQTFAYATYIISK